MEEQLLLDGRKAGRTIMEISQDLPRRYRSASHERWSDVLKFRSQESISPQNEVLASSIQEYSIGVRTGRAKSSSNITTRVRHGKESANSYLPASKFP